MSEIGADWYHRYHQRWLGGVRGLKARQIAVYDIVTELIYQDGGETANNPKYIAGFFDDLGTAAVRKTIGELIELGKLVESGGKISNKFAKNEAKTKEKLRENRSKAGEKGNKIRWQNSKNTNENNETPSQVRSQESSQIREDKRRDSETKVSGDSADLFGELEKPKEPSAFDIAVAWFTEAGVARPERHRALIGKWLKALDGNHDRLKAAIYSARARDIVDPVSYIAAAIRNQAGGQTQQAAPALPLDQLPTDLRSRYEQGSQISVNGWVYQKGFDPFVRSEAA